MAKLSLTFCVILLGAAAIVSSDRSWNNRASNYQNNALNHHRQTSSQSATSSHLASNAIPRKPRAHRRRQSTVQLQQQLQPQQQMQKLTAPPPPQPEVRPISKIVQEYPEAQYRYSPASSPSSTSLSSSSISSSVSSSISSPHQRTPAQLKVDEARQSAIAAYQSYLSQNPMIPLSMNNQILYRHQMLPHQSPFLGASSSSNSAQAIVSASSASANAVGLTNEQKKLNQMTSKSRKSGQWWNLAKTPTNMPTNVAIDADLNGVHTNAIVPSGPSSAASSNAIVANIKFPNLRKKQKKLIKDNPGLLLAIAKAMRLAIHECQHQFKDRRWNCPVNEWKKGKSIFGRIIQTGCRETAFVYALTSAAVAHSIARACSEGLIETCTCDYTPNRLASGNDWEWGGCSDNIKFGYKFARSFVDAAENSRDHRFVMNMHNNEAGRTHVGQMMRRECKCHGMSGSCTVKTCWMKLAPFHEIGNSLKDRFDGASRVRIGNDFRDYKELRKSAYRKIPVEPFENGYKPPSNKDLIYFDESPDFCVANPKYGVAGTPGRICNASSIGVDGCHLLCCGRGYTTEEVEVTERCNCTFQWCCQVHCQSCKVKKKIHRCN